MGVVTALVIAGAAIAAAGAAGSAYAKKKAGDKAIKQQERALTGQKRILRDELSFERLNQAATDADRLRAKNRLALQEEIDPELAQLRQLGKEQLLRETSRSNESLGSTQVANKLVEENINADPRIEALKDSIIGRAQEELDAGSTLPPEFQADLVRAGVSEGGQAGFRPTAKTIGGSITRALGIAGEQLKQGRQQQAVSLAGAATNLTESRANILSSIFPTVKASEDARKRDAAAAFGIGDSTLPESGLTGREATTIQQNRGNTLLKIRGKRGDLKAQKAINAGEANAAYIKAGASFASSSLGAFGGGIGGGGTGGLVSSLGNQQQS
jgi:hypothetical protein